MKRCRDSADLGGRSTFYARAGKCECGHMWIAWWSEDKTMRAYEFGGGHDENNAKSVL